MKKTILFSMGMLYLCTLASAQQGILVDNAVQGTGVNQHNYVGAGWTHGSTQSSFYNNTLSFSNVSGAYVTFTFVGTGIEWYTEKKNTHGKAAVSIDGGGEIFIDLYSSAEQHVLVYSSPVLTQGTHTFKIRVTGTKNASSSGFYVIHDYFKIFSSGPSDFTNTATGHLALASNTTGFLNTAIGKEALYSNTEGHRNIAIGPDALRMNTVGYFNEAIGHEALKSNTSGRYNLAIGSVALLSNTTGVLNVAVGSGALWSNTSGNSNAAQGYGALSRNTTGEGNTAVGNLALGWNNGGHLNTAIGFNAGPHEALPNLENSIAIGYFATTTASNQVRVGNSQVTSIGGQVSWSTLSDGRFKKEIKEDVSGLEFIDKLRPVSYTVDKDAIDKFLNIPDSIRKKSAEARKKTERQTGFVAQEVEAVIKKTGYVFHGVEAPQNASDHYSIRYAEFVVPLVKAVQELNVTVKEQQNEIEVLKQQLEQNNGLANDKIISKGEVALYQNNPNPFSLDTEIKLSLPETTIHAQVIVYNLEGKQLKDMQIRERGNTSVKIAGSELQAGMYLYALIVDGKVVDTKRMILTK